MLIKNYFWLFMMIVLSGCSDTTDNTNENSLHYEAEDYSAIMLGNLSNPQEVRIESQSNASNGKGIHVGPDSDDRNEGIGDGLVYELTIHKKLSHAILSIVYSDDALGNVVSVSVDNLRKGSFISKDTGGWNDFQRACQKVDLGILDKGNHTLKLEVVSGGSFGVILDYFEIAETNLTVTDDRQAAYRFIKGLINADTGLARSTECEDSTSVYKNALAAMIFTHERDFEEAEGIFDFFESNFSSNSFQGFSQNWNSSTGEVEGSINYWEGDNAFLLIALKYYQQASGRSGMYQSMVDGLTDWLARTGNTNDDTIIAEGLIDIFAALKPFEDTLPTDTPDVLLKLQSAFIKNSAYTTVADHIERAALTLGALEGFDQITQFQKTDTWQHDELTPIQGISGFASENIVNTEISGQLLLSWMIWQEDLSTDLSYIVAELETMWLRSNNDPNARGIPYLTRDPANISDSLKPVWPVWFDSPIIDSTAYLLFYYWGFNPMVPGEKSILLDYDYHECEEYSSQSGHGNIETHSDAVGEQTMQVGSDPNDVIYYLNLNRSYSNGILHIRYSDDVAGNLIQVYIDDILQGEFITQKTDGWNEFIWNGDVSVGVQTAGSHVLKLVSTGGTYGVNLDVIKITE